MVFKYTALVMSISAAMSLTACSDSSDPSTPTGNQAPIASFNFNDDNQMDPKLESTSSDPNGDALQFVMVYRRPNYRQ